MCASLRACARGWPKGLVRGLVQGSCTGLVRGACAEALISRGRGPTWNALCGALCGGLCGACAGQIRPDGPSGACVERLCTECRKACARNGCFWPGSPVNFTCVFACAGLVRRLVRMTFFGVEACAGLCGGLCVGLCDRILHTDCQRLQGTDAIERSV